MLRLCVARRQGWLTACRAHVDLLHEIQLPIALHVPLPTLLPLPRPPALNLYPAQPERHEFAEMRLRKLLCPRELCPAACQGRDLLLGFLRACSHCRHRCRGRGCLCHRGSPTNAVLAWVWVRTLARVRTLFRTLMFRTLFRTLMFRTLMIRTLFRTLTFRTPDVPDSVTDSGVGAGADSGVGADSVPDSDVPDSDVPDS